MLLISSISYTIQAASLPISEMNINIVSGYKEDSADWITVDVKMVGLFYLIFLREVYMLLKMIWIKIL